MTDQIYFLGYRPEHYTGWNGSGPAVYSSAYATSTNDFYNNIGYIDIASTTSILWKDLTIQNNLEPICYSFCVGFMIQTSAAKQSYDVVILDSNKNAIDIKFTYIYSGVLNLAINESSYDTSTNSLTTLNTVLASTSIIGNLVGTNSYNVNYHANFYIKLSSSNGTNYDILNVSYCDFSNSFTGTTYSQVSNKTLSVPLTNVSGIYKTAPVNNGNRAYFAYDLVTNFDMTGGYLDYTNVSSSGYYDDWPGTVSTLNTYPMVTNTTANGLYSYNTGDKATFTPTKQLNTNSIMEPKFTFVESSLSSTIDNSKAQGIISNPGTNLVYSLGSADTLTTTNTSYQWFSNQNPATLSSWTVDTINSYNFGIQRTA